MRHFIAMTAAALALALGCAGCGGGYLTPGGAAPLTQIAGADANDSAQQPSPQFPLTLVAVRLQAADYRSLSATGLGKGRFSVIAPPELLTPPQLQTMAQWPQVQKAATFDTDLLPGTFESLADLRLAAAKMQADVLLVYTMATVFHVDGRDRDPDSKLAMSDKPDPGASVNATASLAFVDVRTGYVYGRTQAEAKVDGLAEAGKSKAALDARRRAAEQQAFAALLEAARTAWAGIVSRYQ